MVCPDCGFTCSCYFFHTFNCSDNHDKFHAQIIAEKDHYLTSTSSSSGSIFGPRRIKRCQSCEEEVGVTNHICKKQDISIDFIDLLIKISKIGKKKKDQNE